MYFLKYLDVLIRPSFEGVNRLFVLPFNNNTGRTNHRTVFLPKAVIKISPRAFPIWPSLATGVLIGPLITPWLSLSSPVESAKIKAINDNLYLGMTLSGLHGAKPRWRQQDSSLQQSNAISSNALTYMYNSFANSQVSTNCNFAGDSRTYYISYMYLRRFLLVTSTKHQPKDFFAAIFR